MKEAKKCAYVLCGELFIAERKDQIYCKKGTCKMAAYRLRKQGYETTDLADVLARARDAELQIHGVAGTNLDDVLRAKRYREDALRAAYDAIAAELGLALAPVDEPSDELNEAGDEENAAKNDAEQNPLTPALVREKLRAYLAETSMGQTKFGKLAGVHQSTISQFLTGKTDGSDDVRQSILDVVTQDHGMDRR